MLGRSVNLTTLFLGRLRPPKRLTSTSCTYFRQELTTALLNQRKEKRKYVARSGIEPRTPDLRVRCPTDCATLPGGSIIINRVRVTNPECSLSNGIQVVVLFLRTNYPSKPSCILCFIIIHIKNKLIHVVA